MREGWRQVTLGELFEPSKTRLGEHAAEPPVFSISKHNGVMPAEEFFGKRVASANLANYKMLSADAWVYSTIHIDEGSIARNNTGVDGVVSPMYTVMSWSSRQDDPRYLEHLLRSKDMLAVYADSAQGSINRRRSLSWKAFSAIPIVLPPLDEQQRIVDLIAAVHDAIEAAETEVSASSAAAESLRDKWFGAAAVEVVAGEVFEISAGKQLQKSLLSGEPVPYVRAANLSENRVDVGDIKLMRATDRDVERLYLASGDVLVVEGGFGYGKSAVWRDELPSPVIFQNHVLRIRSINSCYSSDYAFMWAKWCHAAGRWRPTGTDLLNIGVGNARQMRLRETDVGGLPRVLSAAQKQDDLTDAARDTASALRTLRSNLLTVLLSGEHEIPASYDELLEAA